jgi:nifR3 family TIM-barrel protein
VDVVKIGPLTVDPPVVLAPMAGVTNTAFRRVCRSFGGGLYVSEMITARALVEGNARTLKMLSFAPDERPRSVQLYGVDPATMAVAVTRLVDELEVDHVDLNFGCPAAKVTRKGGGAALPLHHVLFERIVRAAVRAAGPVPVTVKLRLGVSDELHTFLRCGLAAAGEGAAAVALHARTAEQHYAGAADWSAIAELRSVVPPDVPVLGNGDIWEAGDALAMVERTGCDGVVVGRGCLGRPWLFRDLADAFAGRPAQAQPRLGEVVAVMQRHLSLLCEHAGDEPGVREFRKHLSWYLLGFPVGTAARRAMALVEGRAELDERLALVAAEQGTIRMPDEARRLPRGHTTGPRRVVLPDGWLDHLDDPNPPEGAELLVSGG